MLPALVLRGLIPVGFMPGHTGLELCWGAIPSSSAIAAYSHGNRVSADHRDRHGTPSQPGDHGAVCAFAASAAGLAPPSVHASIVSALASSELPALGASAVRFTPTILRAQSPRAPPQFS